MTKRIILGFIVLLIVFVVYARAEDKKLKQNIPVAVKKVDMNLHLQGIALVGSQDVNGFKKALEEMEDCVCQPLTDNPDAKVMALTCLCRKKGSKKWVIEE